MQENTSGWERKRPSLGRVHVGSIVISGLGVLIPKANKAPPVMYVCAKCAQRKAYFVYLCLLSGSYTMQALFCSERILLAA